MLSGILQIDRRKDLNSQLLSFQNTIKKYYSIINYLKKERKKAFQLKLHNIVTS